MACSHFHKLLNYFLEDINNTSIHEVNAAYACILFKGHNKEKSSCRSYRTISTCPLVAKALDLYIRDLNVESWNKQQASTQYQGEGSSHELASLLLIECIQYSTVTLKKPLYILYLDAQSAFDVVQRELLIRNLHHAQPLSQSLLYINNRLQHRQTYVDWNGILMGPIHDQQGLEQGGVSSSDLYKIYAKEQLEVAQNSWLGVPLANPEVSVSSSSQNLVVSVIGLADDTALVSNDIFDLYYLLELTKKYDLKYFVNLCAEKTRLQVYLPKNAKQDTIYSVANPIEINGKTISYANTAEHVGLVRSPSGNLVTLLSRFTAHRKAVAGILHTGVARGHRGNPAVGLKVHQLYGTPVLLSGIAPLMLSAQDLTLVEKHYCGILRCLLRLPNKTPRSVVYFLAGSLPGVALVHMRQLSIFGMITRLQDDILNHHARNIFASITISKASWFHQIRQWCVLYSLPHPLDLLNTPLRKNEFKLLVKKHIISYWECQLREESSTLSSLQLFRPSHMSLIRCHPLWTTAGSSPYKVAMATVQASMLSGRYRTESLASHWSRNKTGCCLLDITCVNVREDIPHILQQCPGLKDVRTGLMEFTRKYSMKLPTLISDVLVQNCTTSNPYYCSFLLDCSPVPSVVSLVQVGGYEVLQSLFEVTRTWVFVLHRERLKRLNRWKRGR